MIIIVLPEIYICSRENECWLNIYWFYVLFLCKHDWGKKTKTFRYYIVRFSHNFDPTFITSFFRTCSYIVLDDKAIERKEEEKKSVDPFNNIEKGYSTKSGT